MPFGGLWKTKPKTPAELVTKLRTYLHALHTTAPDDKATKEKLAEKTGKATDLISLLKMSMFGEDDPRMTPPTAADVTAHVQAILATDVMFHMVSALPKLHFETRKDVVAIFSLVCKHRPSQPGAGSGQGSVHSANGMASSTLPDVSSASTKGPMKTPGLDYVRDNPGLLEKLCCGYKDQTIALNCGEMLREALRDPEITRHILESDLLDAFFGYVQINAFEVASDAFTTFKRLLTQHDIVGEFLLANHTRFFSKFEQLLQSTNYATLRQSLKLLQDILLARSNVRVMFNYVKSRRQLMLVMNLLRSSSRSIQLEAFHVFKVFVANPKKNSDIKAILSSNREKLLRFLKQFLAEKEAEDEDFAQEKADIMKELETLEDENSGAMSEGLTKSPSMSSRDIASFRNMSFQMLDRQDDGGDSQAGLGTSNSNQSLSQQFGNQSQQPPANGSSS